MPTWTTPLDFPAGIRITDVSITPENSVGIRESPSSFRQEVQVFGGQRMRMRVSFKEEGPELGSRLETFFLKLRGSAGVFRFFDPYHSVPMGQAMGLPIVVSATAGQQTVTTSGWLPNVNFQLRAGDYIQIEDNLHRVLDDAHSDGDGEATLTLWPDLRASHAPGESIKLINPTGLWRLARDPSFDRRPENQKHVTSMECVEVR
jgi:hypothetical protein